MRSSGDWDLEFPVPVTLVRSYFDDFILRWKFMTNWVKEGIPSCPLCLGFPLWQTSVPVLSLQRRASAHRKHYCPSQC